MFQLIVKKRFLIINQHKHQKLEKNMEHFAVFFLLYVTVLWLSLNYCLAG